MLGYKISPFHSDGEEKTYLGHATVNDKVGTVNEAGLVTGKEDDGLGLLDGLTEAASGEVDLTAVALGLVVTEPVLEERSAVFSC